MIKVDAHRVCKYFIPCAFVMDSGCVYKSLQL